MMLALALTLHTLYGTSANPFAGTQRATVFVFIDPHCPVSSRYAPELNRLYDEYSSRSIRMWLVYAGPEADESTLRTHYREHGLRAPALRDPGFQLAELAGATVTPEAAVFTEEQRLVYRGRIDDRATRPGVWRATAATRDLHAVLDRVARRERVEPFTTRAVGCYIKPLS